jgi:hypothetical protein
VRQGAINKMTAAVDNKGQPTSTGDLHLCNMTNLQFRIILLVDRIQELLALTLLLYILGQQPTWASDTAGCTESSWCHTAGTATRIHIT